MVLGNETDQDTRVRLGGGGSGTDPEPDGDLEEPSMWPVLPPGGTLHLKPLPPGPWKVTFLVNGRRVVTQVDSDSGKVTLAPSGRSFKARIE